MMTDEDIPSIVIIPDEIPVIVIKMEDIIAEQKRTNELLSKNLKEPDEFYPFKLFFSVVLTMIFVVYFIEPKKDLFRIENPDIIVIKNYLFFIILFLVILVWHCLFKIK